MQLRQTRGAGVPGLRRRGRARRADPIPDLRCRARLRGGQPAPGRDGTVCRRGGRGSPGAGLRARTRAQTAVVPLREPDRPVREGGRQQLPGHRDHGGAGHPQR